MMKPQILTQTYIEEASIFPKGLKENIEKGEIRNQEIIKNTEEKRAKKRYETLLQDKEAHKKLLSECKPLGPRHRIFGKDKEQFKELIEDITGEPIKASLEQMKPLKWRKFIVRLVCTDNKKVGDELRSVWVSMYKGDLKWGVRDARLQAKEKNWPKMDGNSYLQKHDRNSWIASCVRKSLLTEFKINKKILD